jgi:hypothetical protein
MLLQPETLGNFGVAEFDAADTGPVPTLLVAVTVNVYAVPFVSPVTVQVVVDVVQAKLPGLERTL